MLIIDDILISPFMFIMREIHNAALEELAREPENIRIELSELYKMLEAGRITEQQFDTREAELLDRLEALEASNTEGQV
jgi:hypothetical protein